PGVSHFWKLQTSPAWQHAAPQATPEAQQAPLTHTPPSPQGSPSLQLGPLSRMKPAPSPPEPTCPPVPVVVAAAPPVPVWPWPPVPVPAVVVLTLPPHEAAVAARVAKETTPNASARFMRRPPGRPWYGGARKVRRRRTD